MEIQSTNLRTIALFAARSLAKNDGRLILVEDSGLFIQSLNGFPGPYSSYVHRTVGLEGILRLMKGVRSRRAYFQSVVAACCTRMQFRTFVGRVDGRIAQGLKGGAGFGYDPVFAPGRETRTFAEMSPTQKNSYSHRGLSFRKFAEWYLHGLNEGMGRPAEP